MEMRDLLRTTRSALLVCGLFVLAGCKGGSAVDDDDQSGRTTGGENPDAESGSTPATGGTGGTVTVGPVGGAPGMGGSGGSGGSGRLDGSAGGSRGDAGATPPAPDGGIVVAPIDCAGALFCENFDRYPTITTIANRQRFGPWHATLNSGATMALDGAHKVSGANALHVHIDGAVTAGGRLFADGNQPLFAAKATHLYGRMMMYISPNGTSVHWTFFGENGPAEPGSPVAGKYASYILSSLPRRAMNTYSFVYGLSAPEGYHDCSSQSATAMPSTWACVSFEMDSVTRKLRMYKDGAATPILSVDDHGRGCVAPTSATSPWYGPVVNQIFVGAWSFHQMNAPLDVWIDDLVVDTKPVSCAAQ